MELIAQYHNSLKGNYNYYKYIIFQKIIIKAKRHALLLSDNSLPIGHSGMGLAGHGALWVNPETIELDPGSRRGDDYDYKLSDVVTTLGLLIIEMNTCHSNITFMNLLFGLSTIITPAT